MLKACISIVLLFAVFVAPAAMQEATPEATEVMSSNPYVIADTVAYWSFANPDATGEAIAADAVVLDLSGNGNDLTRVDLENASPEDVMWTDDAAENMPSAGSMRIIGNNETKVGGFLMTDEAAPLNEMTFEDGYTIEAFIKLPEDWNPDTNQWTGILGRQGTGADAKMTEGDLEEGIGYLGVSNFPEFQFAVWTTNLPAMQTNWSDQIAFDEWYHVAIVNDTDTTIMYVNGEEVLRNPDAGQIGIMTNNLPWTVGSSNYGNVNNSFNGWIGDIRIVARPLGFDEFLTAPMQ